MKLTPREFEVASVAADLLMKGNPATRIAQYCLRKKMNLSQVYKLVNKLPIAQVFRNSIVTTFHSLDERPDIGDESMSNGRRLKEALDLWKNTRSKS